MTITKKQVETEMNKQGVCWATRGDKHIHPDDEFGARPTWHVHPNASYPHAADVKRFDTLEELWAWLTEEGNE